jgi:hypothetical protein
MSKLSDEGENSKHNCFKDSSSSSGFTDYPFCMYQFIVNFIDIWTLWTGNRVIMGTLPTQDETITDKEGGHTFMLRFVFASTTLV